MVNERAGSAWRPLVKGPYFSLEAPSKGGPPSTFGGPLQGRSPKNVWDPNGVSKVPPMCYSLQWLVDFYLGMTEALNTESIYSVKHRDSGLKQILLKCACLLTQAESESPNNDALWGFLQPLNCHHSEQPLQQITGCRTCSEQYFHVSRFLLVVVFTKD